MVDPLLKQKLHHFLTSHELIGRDREVHFVVAYSGGRDSTALLHVLHALKQESPETIKLTAAYYWHPWRSLVEDIQVVYQNCKAMGIQWVMLTPNLNLPKTETAARQDRYHQLAQLTADLDATALLTAHHQDDQIETVLFRVLRGTGVEGIAGIPQIRALKTPKGQTVCLARPFITEPRSEINAYIQEHQLHYVEDPTNADVKFKRNFIRQQLLPQIESEFPQVRQSMLRLSQLAEGEMSIVHHKIDEIWGELYDLQTKSLDEVRFNQLARPFQRRIIRRFLDEAGQEAGYNKVEEIIDFMAGKNRILHKPAMLSLDSRHFLSVYRNRMTIEMPQKSQIAPIKVGIPGQVSHRELKTTISIVPLTPEQRMKPIDFAKLPDEQVYVDLSRFEGQELILRSRQEGDRIKPLGMASPIKLKRFFINRCIPRFKRDSIPLLATEQEVLWAIGVGLSEEIRVKDRPTHMITFNRG